MESLNGQNNFISARTAKLIYASCGMMNPNLKSELVLSHQIYPSCMQ